MFYVLMNAETHIFTFAQSVMVLLPVFFLDLLQEFE